MLGKFADRYYRMTFYRRSVSIFLVLFMVNLTVAAQVVEEEFTSLLAIPRSYRDIELGMNPEMVKSLLKEDGWFDYRGDADLSLLERPRAAVIETKGSLFIARGYFQFEEDELISIVLELDERNIDWFTLFTTLEDRYGTPTDMNPTKAWWEDENTRLALERPLTVKYLDLGVFDAAVAEQTNRAAWRAEERAKFLDEF